MGWKSVKVKTDVKVSMKQLRAIEVLLVGGSDQQAADAAGVTRTTVSHWRNHAPAFAEALRIARRDVLQRSSARLHASTLGAVKALEDISKDPNAAGARGSSSRVSAARSIIELSQKAYELEDIDVRMKAIERSMEDEKKASGR